MQQLLCYSPTLDSLHVLAYIWLHLPACQTICLQEVKLVEVGPTEYQLVVKGQGEETRRAGVMLGSSSDALSS